MHTDLTLHRDTSMASYRQRAAVRQARDYDRWIRGREIEAIWLRYRLLPAAQLTRIGNAVADFDREMRRAAVVVSAPWGDRGVPRPLPVQHAGLRIVAARSGSLDLLLDGTGGVASALLSTPVQLLLTTQALVGNAARIRVWWGRRTDIARRISLQDALDVYERLEAFRRSHSGELPPEVEDSGQQPAPLGLPSQAQPQAPPRRRRDDWTPPTDKGPEPDTEVILDGGQAQMPHDLMLMVMDDEEIAHVIEVSEEW